MQSTFFTREHIIEGVIAIVLLVGTWFLISETIEKRTILPNITTASSTETEASLGATIYAESSNPLSDVPDQKPVSNPIDDAYKNPF